MTKAPLLPTKCNDFFYSQRKDKFAVFCFGCQFSLRIVTFTTIEWKFSPSLQGISWQNVFIHPATTWEYFELFNLELLQCIHGYIISSPFLQQILTYGGFYDNLEWVGLEAVTVVSTMTAGTGLGRHLLNTRFTSVMRIISINEPDKVNDFIH